MPLPNPTSTWRAVRFLAREAAFALPAAAAYLEGLLDQHESVADLAWVRAHVRYARTTPAGTSEDFAEFKLDLLNITGGAVDTSWTAGDFAACDTAIQTFLTTQAPRTAPNHTAKEIRYYAMAFNPADPGPGGGIGSPPRPFLDTGPPIYVKAVNTVGTNSNWFPYQVSATITLRTAWPRHWGRIYLPGAALGLDANGRWTAATTQPTANAMFDLLDDLAAAGFLVVIPTTQASKALVHGLLGVTTAVVDDIPDVVRRRRPKTAAVRSVGIE